VIEPDRKEIHWLAAPLRSGANSNPASLTAALANAPD
jgi:hypothetical protein